MRNLRVTATGAIALLTTGVAWAQNGSMMHGGSGWMGGYGGAWGPMLLVIVVAAVVAWAFDRK